MLMFLCLKLDNTPASVYSFIEDVSMFILLLFPPFETLYLTTAENKHIQKNVFIYFKKLTSNPMHLNIEEHSNKQLDFK